MRTPSTIGLVIFLVALLLCGCNKAGTPGQGPLISSPEDLHPTALQLKRAKLTAGGTSIDSTLTTSSDGQRYFIDSFVDGTRMEREIYQNGDRSFDILGATGEVFEPPIPLIKYGMHVGDTWTWKGSTSIVEGKSQPAKATISSAADDLWLNNALMHDVVKVEVTLQLDSGTDQPALRKMQFWFVKDKGIVKRAFGAALIREPAED